MSAPSTPEPVALLLCDDLMFGSRITGTARDLGLAIKTARSVEILEKLAEQQPVTCVIVDLGNSTLKIAELLDSLRKKCSPMPRLVAYGSHVDAAGLQAARDAGCDIVLPRSRFVEALPRDLTAWFKP